jgi:outer membrane protein with glycine zipper
MTREQGDKLMGGKMTKRNSIKVAMLGLTAVIAAGCAGGSLTTREKGAGIGAVGGAAAGGLIGSAFGRPGMGAAIGAGAGLAGGALIGDYMQGQEQEQYQYNQQQLQQNQRTIERNRQAVQRQQQGEY